MDRMLQYASHTFFGIVNIKPIKENLWLKLSPAFMPCTTKSFPDFLQSTSSGNYSKVYKDCDKFFPQRNRLPRKDMDLLKQVLTRAVEIMRAGVFQSGEVKVSMRLYKKNGDL